MFTGLCSSSYWGSFGTFGAAGWVGLILNFVVTVGLLAGLALLVVWALRRDRAHAAQAPYAAGRPSAKEILQARYARGEITREQYELARQDIG